MPESNSKTARPRRMLPARSKTTGSDVSAPPKKSFSGATPAPPRPRTQPPSRAKSFDGTGGVIKSGSDHTTPASSRRLRTSNGTPSSSASASPSSRMLTQKEGSNRSLRNLLPTAKSMQNVFEKAPETAVKMILAPAAPKKKVRPGMMPMSALSSKNVMAEMKKERNPLRRTMSSDKLTIKRAGTTGSTNNYNNNGATMATKSTPRRTRSVSPSSAQQQQQGPAASDRTARGGRRPTRSLFPTKQSKSERPIRHADDDDAVFIA